MKVRFSITLDEELVRKIDKRRKKIPRSTYINEKMNIVERRLKKR